MTEHGDEKPVLILWIDSDRPDLLPLAQGQMLPRSAAVCGFIHAVAGREIGPLQALAAADVDHVRIRRRNGDIADRSGRLVVEDRFPCSPGVVGLPDAAVIDADVKDVWLRRYPDRSDRSSAAKWPDHSPSHALIQRCINGLRV